MKKLLLTSTLIMAGFTANGLQAQNLTRADVETIIKEYITANPEVILDAVEAYGERQQQISAEEQQKSIEKHLGWLENNDMLPVAGNPNGDVTVVEFFDYNCGYCKKALDDITKLMGEDKDIKFVFVELPILGRTSELAARYALAAKNQDAYLDYHIGLMNNRGPLDEKSMKNVANKIGLDFEKLKADAESDEIAKQVSEKANKASEMGISGTPAFIINGKLYGGYIGLDRMRKAVADAREG